MFDKESDIDIVIDDYLPILAEELDKIEEIIVSLNKEIINNEQIRILLGIIHSVKGSAGSYGLQYISTVCHLLEDFIEKDVQGKNISAEIVDQLLVFFDLITDCMNYYNDPDIETKKKIERELVRVNQIFNTSDIKSKTLIVEISKSMSKVYCDVIEKFGSDVEICHEGGCATARLLSGEFHILITANDLKDTDGPSLIKIARELTPKAGVIITILISSNAKESRKESNMSPDFFIEKGLELAIKLEETFKIIDSGMECYRGRISSTALADIKNITVVDDDQSLHALLNTTLKKQDRFNFNYSTGGRGFITEAIENIPDLFIFDVMMPEVDGISLFNLVKEEKLLRHIPVIFLTAKEKRKEINELLALGAAGVIKKPFSPTNIIGFICKIFGATCQESV